MAAAELDQRNDLIRDMQLECRAWRRGIVGWGTTYGVLRLLAIVLSAIVAAKLWEQAIPVMALLVAIITSVDAWQKPQVKWHGFVQDRDDLDALTNRAMSPSADVDVLSEDFRKLRTRHSDNNMY